MWATACNTACKLLGAASAGRAGESRVALLFMVRYRGTCQGGERAGRCAVWMAN